MNTDMATQNISLVLSADLIVNDFLKPIKRIDYEQKHFLQILKVCLRR